MLLLLLGPDPGRREVTGGRLRAPGVNISNTTSIQEVDHCWETKPVCSGPVETGASAVSMFLHVEVVPTFGLFPLEVFWEETRGHTIWPGNT